ncbi:MAG: hypothetical protein AB9869_28570 [Verrucomicrobiia bacterium]
MKENQQNESRAALEWRELRDYLTASPAGMISDRERLAKLLSVCWDQFDGANGGGMQAYKLHQRMERIEWKPPFLSFCIERHGGMTFGSSRAELQIWELNLEDKTASHGSAGYRQIYPRSPALDVQPMADATAGEIVERKRSSNLKWSPDGKTVRVLMGQLIPAKSAVKQTLAARRKRLRLAIEANLAKSGWRKLRANTFTAESSGGYHIEGQTVCIGAIQARHGTSIRP